MSILNKKNCLWKRNITLTAKFAELQLATTSDSNMNIKYMHFVPSKKIIFTTLIFIHNFNIDILPNKLINYRLQKYKKLFKTQIALKRYGKIQYN